MLPKITVHSGNMTGSGAKFLVNSANGYLLHGSGTAEQIRNHLGRIVDGEALRDYQKLLSEAKHPLKPALEYMNNAQKREPSVLQYAFGDLAVSNAVGMTYEWEEKPAEGSLPVAPATKESVKGSLLKSLGFAESLGYDKVAIPIMCARKGGLRKDESAEATVSAIKEHFSRISQSAIHEINVVLHDKSLQEDEKYFEKFFRNACFLRSLKPVFLEHGIMLVVY